LGNYSDRQPHHLEEKTMRTLHAQLAAIAIGAALGAPALAAVTPPAGYIYTTQLLDNLTEGCLAAGPGGTFVGIGPGFTANAQTVVLAKESGDLRVVAMGFNSISDCAYDAASDTLYITDNATNADLGITTGMAGNTGAQSGDTVFAVPAASTASGLSAKGLELLPAGSIHFAANVTLGAGGVLVADSVGGGAGSVLKITAGPSTSTFASSLALAGGVAVNPANGNVFVAENLGPPNFDNQIRQYTAAGAPVAPVPFAGPSFGFGSVDLAFNSDGRLLATGNFLADVVSFDPSTAAATPFVSGLTFATGITVEPFTHRVQILSSTFTGADEDKSLHRFTPIDRLVPGSGSPKSECVQEFYGVQLVGKEAVCVDGAPCDADGAQNGSCLFPLGFCFNVNDPHFSECALGTVSSVSLSAKPGSAALTQTASAITAALPLSGPACFFSDGVAVPVQVAGAVKKPGKAQVKVQSSTDDGRKDTDVVKLVCQPAP
jgi:hypothetical protein